MDEATLVQLARAVAADDRAMLYGPENDDTHGWHTIPAAVAASRTTPGWTYLVTVHDDVLAVEADVGEHATSGIDGLQAALARAGIRSVVVQSGRPEHRHLFARVGAERAEWDTTAKRGFGVQPRHTIRPPLAPHRLGLPVELAGGMTVAEALAILAPSAPIAPLTVSPSPSRPLSPHMAAVLRGDVTDAYPSRSERAYALAVAAHNAGWTFPAYRDALLDPANTGGEKVQAMVRLKGAAGQRRADGWLRRAWDRAAQWVAARPPTADPDTRQRIKAIAAAAHAWDGQHAYKPRCWPTDLAVLDACTYIAGRAGRCDIDLAVRDVAELANVATITASRALRRLCGRGWLRPAPTRGRGRDPQHARRFTVTVPDGTMLQDTHFLHPTPMGVRQCVSRTIALGSDAFVPKRPTQRGLGKASGRVYLRLAEQAASGVTVRNLSDWLGIQPPQVRVYLHRLAAVGLAAQTLDGRWIAGDADLEVVAVKVGTAGTQDRRKLLHEEERDLYRRDLAMRAAERQAVVELAAARGWPAVVVNVGGRDRRKVAVAGEAAWRQFVGRATSPTCRWARAALWRQATVTVPPVHCTAGLKIAARVMRTRRRKPKPPDVSALANVSGP